MGKRNKSLITAVCFGLLFFTLSTTLSFQSAPQTDTTDSVLAIKAGTILPVTSEPVSDGVILIRNGKIEAVGKKINIPENAEIMDAADKVVIPGLIDAITTLPEQGRDDEESISPDIRAIDAFDFYGKYHKILSGGITTVYISPGRNRLMPGFGSVVKLVGDSPEQQTLKASAGLSVILGEAPKNPPALFDPPVPPDPDNPIKPAQKQLPTTRMAEMSLLRQTFSQIQWKKKNSPKQIDLKTEPLLSVLNKKQPLRVNCHTARDILNALSLAKEYRLKLIIEGATEAYKVIDEIKAAQASVVVTAPFEPGRSYTRDLTRTPALGIPDPDNVVALSQANIPFALASPTDRSIPELQFSAGITVSQGLTPDQALKAITIEPAKILGVSNRVGSIEKGKDADLVFLSTPPFDLGSRVEQTLINGKTVYTRPAPEEEEPEKDKPLLAVKAGKILTASRGQIHDGLILIQDGIITYRGKSKSLPEGTEVIDASKSVVIPGMIDIHSHLGLHAESTLSVQNPPPATTGPDSGNVRLASIAHAIVSDDKAFTQTLRSGVTSILLAPQTRGLVSGNGAVVKLAGDIPDKRIVKEYAAVKFSMLGGSPRRGLISQARDTLKRAKEYADRWDRYEKKYKEYLQRQARSTPDPVKPPDLPGRDSDLELLRRLFKRETTALVHVSRDYEIRNALQVFRDEYNLDVILLGATDAYRIIPDLRKYNVPVALGPDILIYDKTKSINNAALLTEKGLDIALHTSATSGTQYLPVNAAYAVRFGLDTDKALQAVTLMPARMLHVEDRIGSIDTGKDADLVILSGDPFEFTTKVEKVIVNGQIIFAGNE